MSFATWLSLSATLVFRVACWRFANALDEMSRAAAAKLAGMDRQTPRDRVIRYNEANVEGLGARWGSRRHQHGWR